MSTSSTSTRLDTIQGPFKKWDELPFNQKICILTGLALSIIGALALVTLALTQTGVLKTVLGKYHILLTEKQIFTITISTAIGGSAALLVGIPCLVIPSCKSSASSATLIQSGQSVKQCNLSHLSQSTNLPTSYTPDEFRELLIEGSIFPPTPIIVKGNLWFYDRSVIKSLPENLRVQGDLDLSGSSLPSLPKGLQVEGMLDCSYCESLKSFDADLKVEGDFILLACTSLSSLPQGLHVGGNLALCHCTSLPSSLPQGLHVGGCLALDNTSLSLSESIEVQLGGDLSLCDCTNVSSLPCWVTALGLRSDGTERTVQLVNTGFSQAELKELHERRIPGMRFQW